MHPSTFFRASLLLPIAAPLLLWQLLPGAMSGVMLLSLLVAGVPYAVFALVMAWKLGAETDGRRMPRTLLLAPLSFLPVQLIAWLAWSAYVGGVGPNLVGSMFAFVPIALFALMFGYSYVGATATLLALCNARGWIRHETPPGRRADP